MVRHFFIYEGKLKTLCASNHFQVSLNQGRIQGARSPPIKPTKATSFTMILYNSENSIRDVRPVCRPFFVTAVLWGILHLPYSSKRILSLDCRILLNSPPHKITGWIRPWSELFALKLWKHLEVVNTYNQGVIQWLHWFGLLEIKFAWSVSWTETSLTPLYYTKYFWKLHLYPKTSATLNLSYLAFCRFCEDELLFGTSDVCLIATLLFFL